VARQYRQELVNSPRIIVTRRLPAAVEQDLVARYDALLNGDDHQFTRDELSAAMRDADIVLCTLTDDLSRPTLEAARGGRARLLANYGVGFNHIDLAAAKELGLSVTNTPGVLTEDTADHTLLLILAVARRAGEGERELRAGRWTGWRPTHLLGSRVSGKTLGIIGFGRIGRAVAARAHHGFGMKILYHSRTPADAAIEKATGASRCDSLESLLQQSDFVSLHCPATPDTRHLMNEARLRLMQPHAYLINTSRGDVVDEQALVAALDEKRIAGAALDVFDGEPHVNPQLLARENVALLPHLGSATIESRVAMGRRTVANIDAFVAQRPLPDRIA
jgi:lactate dehydrogenase-like 2-hydroxyacid dehydrogenase